MGIASRAVGAALLVVVVGACGAGDDVDTVVAGQAAESSAVDPQPVEATPSTEPVTVPELDCGDGLVATASPMYGDPPVGENRPLSDAVAATVEQYVGSAPLATGIEQLGATYETQAREAGAADAAARIDAGDLIVATVVTDDPAAPDRSTAIVTVTDGTALVAALSFAELAPDHWVMAAASACAEVPG